MHRHASCAQPQLLWYALFESGLAQEGEAGGCEACHYTGYKGRQAVYEVISLDKDLGELIKNGIFDASKELKEREIKSLSENAYQMLANGLTTLEEVYPILING